MLPKALALSPGPLKDDFAQALKGDAEGVMSDYLWEPVDQKPASKEFTAKWRAAYKDEPDVQSGFGWVGGQLLEAAVKSAGALDNEKFREAFLRLDTETLLPGRFKMDQQHGAPDRPDARRGPVAGRQAADRRTAKPRYRADDHHTRTVGEAT